MASVLQNIRGAAQTAASSSGGNKSSGKAAGTKQPANQKNSSSTGRGRKSYTLQNMEDQKSNRAAAAGKDTKTSSSSSSSQDNGRGRKSYTLQALEDERASQDYGKYHGGSTLNVEAQTFTKDNKPVGGQYTQQANDEDGWVDHFAEWDAQDAAQAQHRENAQKLDQRIAELQREGQTNSDIYVDGIYMGTDKQTADAYSKRIGELQKQADAEWEAAGGRDQTWLDRAKNVVVGGAQGWAGPQAKYFGAGAETLSIAGERLGSNTSDYAGWATDELSAAQIGTENDPTKRAQQLAEARGWQAKGREWTNQGNEKLDKAKEGAGWLGNTLVDLGANAVQTGMDAATGPLAMVSLFTRAAGGGMLEAEAEGADLLHQQLYGNTIGALEVATEGLFDGVAKIYGKGAADDVVESLVKKLAKTDGGRKALLWASSVGGEAVEELISAGLDPAAKTLYNGQSLADSYRENFSLRDMLHDGLIGGLMGGVFGAGTAVTGGYTNTTQKMHYAENATAMLTDMGVDADSAEALGDIIAKQASGEELSALEHELLDKSEAAQEVLKYTPQAPSPEGNMRLFLAPASNDPGLKTVSEQNASALSGVKANAASFLDAKINGTEGPDNVLGGFTDPANFANLPREAQEAARAFARTDGAEIATQNILNYVGDIVRGTETGNPLAWDAAQSEAATGYVLGILNNYFQGGEAVDPKRQQAIAAEAVEFAQSGLTLDEAAGIGRQTAHLDVTARPAEDFAETAEGADQLSAPVPVVTTGTESMQASENETISRIQERGTISTREASRIQRDPALRPAFEAAYRISLEGKGEKAATQAIIKAVNKQSSRERAAGQWGEIPEARPGFDTENAAHQRWQRDYDRFQNAKQEINEMLEEKDSLSNKDAAKIMGDDFLLAAFREVTGMSDAKSNSAQNMQRAFKEAKKSLRDVDTADVLSEAATGKSTAGGINSQANAENAEKAGLNRSESKTAKKPGTPRAKYGSGTVSFDGATLEGRDYAAVDMSSLTLKQKSQISALEKVAEATGVNIVFYQSKTDERGRYRGANGAYKDGTVYLDVNAGLSKINPDGTTVGEIAIIRTAGHELTHFIQQFNESDYNNIRDYIVKTLAAKNGVDGLEDLIKIKLDIAKRAGNELSRDGAINEVIADGCEMMLRDSEAIENLAKENRSLAYKIRRWIKQWAQKIHAAFEGVEANSAEAKILMENADKLQKLWDAGLENAAKAQAPDAQNATEEAFVTEAGETDAAPAQQYSLRSMNHDLQEGKMFEDLAEHTDMSSKEIENLRAGLTNLVDQIANNTTSDGVAWRDILDLNETYGKDDRPFKPYKPNSDPLYTISLDFSTLCRKRLMTQYVIEKLQTELDNSETGSKGRALSAEEQLAVRDLMKEYAQQEKALKVACAMCYVEAARLKAPKQINKFISDPESGMLRFFALKNKEFNDSVKKAQADFKEQHGYDRKAAKKDMKPADVRALNKLSDKLRNAYGDAAHPATAEELEAIRVAKTLPNSTYLTASNLARLAEEHPLIYDAYTATIRTATRSKSLEADIPYYYGDSREAVSDDFIKNITAENGMRFSSWSDFQIQHMLDMMTAVIELSGRHSAMHGYTKFLEQVRIFGKTGMMFNMSGVPQGTGLKADGSLDFSPTESVLVKSEDGSEYDAIKARDEFPETAGLQCIGISEDHIKALLASDIIDYIIPYHTSGLNASLRRMAQISNWDDFTSFQNASEDKSIKFDSKIHDKETWHKEPVFSEFFNAAKDPANGFKKGEAGIETMRRAADLYKEMCKERGLRPKFSWGNSKVNADFSNDPNYWKLLIDRKMINQKTGKLIEQKPVRPDFDFELIDNMVKEAVDAYDPSLQERALGYVREHLDELPQRISDLKKSGAVKKAKANAKKTDELNKKFTELQAGIVAAATDGNLKAQMSDRDTGVDDAPVKQEISSAATSINANKLPVLYTNKNAEFKDGGTNIDIGGGRFDNVTEYLKDSHGVRNMIFDPFNRSEESNTKTLQYLQNGEQADTATCSNVLNVIAEPAARSNVILEAAKSIKPDGKAYFTVYEGDGSGVGAKTKSGWQENRKTATYVPEVEKYFDKVTRKGNIIIAENPKADLPKAAWETTPGKATKFQMRDVEEDTEPEAARPEPQKEAPKRYRPKDTAAILADASKPRAPKRVLTKGSGEEKTSKFYSGTMTKNGTAKGIPEITYPVKSESESLANAAARLKADYRGMINHLVSAEAWSGEMTDAAAIVAQELRKDARRTGDSKAYEDWLRIQSEKQRESGRGVQAVAKQSRPGSEVVLRTLMKEIELARQNNAEAVKTRRADKYIPEETLKKAENKAHEITDRMLDIEIEIDDKIDSGMDEHEARESTKEEWLKLIDDINAFRHTGLMQDADVNEAMRRHGVTLNTKFRKMLAAEDVEYIMRFAACDAAGISEDIYYKGEQDFLKRLNTWQKLAQLTGTGTWGRNLIGNGSFGLIDVLAANNPATIIADAVLGAKTGKRSSGLESGVLNKEARAAARHFLNRSILEVAANIDLATDSDQTKYDMGRNRTYDPNGNAFERVASRWEQWNGYMLESSDAWFKGLAEGSAEQAIRKANKWGEDNLTREERITLSEDEASKLSKSRQKELDEVKQQIAKYRTFQNDGIAAEAANEIRDWLNKKGAKLVGKEWKKGQFGLGTALMPYTKVPTNLGVKSLEFSPLGAAKGLAEMIRVANDPNATMAQQNKAVTDFGRGLTGTMLIALMSSLMKNAPWFKDWEDEEDKDIKAQNKAEGKSGIQVNWSMLMRRINGDKSSEWRNGDQVVDISSMEPVNQLLTTASLIAEGEAPSIALFKSAKDNLMGLPSLQALKNIEDSIKYTDTPDDGWKTLLSTAASTTGSVAGGMIPAPIRHFAALDDPYARDTSADSQVLRAFNQTISSIPGLRKTLPKKTDAFGNDVWAGNIKTRAANQYLPFKHNQVNQSAASREINRIYEETGENHMPSRTGPKTVQFGSGDDAEKVTLTARERKAFKDESGQDYQSQVEALIQTGFYRMSDDDTREAMIAALESYSKDTAKVDLADSHGIDYDGQYEEVRGLENPARYLGVRAGFQTTLKGEDYDAVDMLLDAASRLPAGDRAYMREHTDNFGTYYDLAEQGVGAGATAQYQTALKERVAAEEKTTANGYDIFQTVVEEGFTDEEADAFMNRTKSDGSYYVAKGRHAVYEGVRNAGGSPADALNVWDLLDSNGNGTLTKGEAKAGIKKLPKSQRAAVTKALKDAGII